MEAVLLPWLATTARPNGWLMAMPCGEGPTPKGLPIICPKVALAGLRSRATMLLQPVTLTRPSGEKVPLAIWSAMATEVGCVFTGLPLESVHTLDKSTDSITRNSATLDCTPWL